MTITSEGGKSVKVKSDELVILPAGMKCRCNVHQAVRKNYRFGD